jgi:hypothetical protein
MTDLRTLNKKKLLTLLDTEILTLLEIARLTLDSWPMRMQIELKTKMTESRLEGLGLLIDGAVMNSAEGGAPLRPPVYSNDFHDDEPESPKFEAE